MPREITKVAYRPKVESNEHFIVVVDPEAYKQWLENKEVPLVDVVDSFMVLFSDQGPHGLLGQATKQQLENTFGTHNEDDVIRRILQDGKAETAKGIRSGTGFGTKNVTMGSVVVDTRGNSHTGIGRG